MTTTDSAVADVDGVETDLWPILEQLGRGLHLAATEPDAAVLAVVQHVVDAVDAADYAGVNLLIRGRFVPQAVVGRPVHQLDALQEATDTGPCVDSAREQRVVRIDVGDEQQWPDYVALARSLGVTAQLCLPLWVETTRLGSLSLYSTRTTGFSERDERIGGYLATHAALALAEARRASNLRAALVNRDTIGQAKGILMERHKITGDEAFDRLVKASQASNRKLAAVAEDFVRTGSLDAI